MLTFEKMLDALHARAGSDAKAAPLVGVKQSSFSQWRRRHALPDDEQARRIAELLDLDPAYVLAVIHGERAKSKETRATWRRMAEVFGKAAALAVVSVTPFLASPGFNNSLNAPTSGGAPMTQVLNTQCPTRRRRSTWSAALAALLLGITASACTVISHKPAPDDFPRLRIVEHHLPAGAMFAQCYQYVPLLWKLMGSIVEGCAVAHFDRGECHIYVRSDFPDARVHEHERLHCAGREHPGSSTVSDAWRTWRDTMAREGATFVYVRADGQTVSYRTPR